MAQTGAILVTIEASFNGRPFEVTQPDQSLQYQVHTDTVIWHKERLLNIAIKRLRRDRPAAEHVAWIDCDVTFADPQWVEHALDALRVYQIIQPFSVAVNLNHHEEYMWHCEGAFKAFLVGRGFHQEPPLPVSYTFKGHPGLAWCARMSTLEKLGGLFDTCIAGSGDLVMGNALKGDYAAALPEGVCPSFASEMEAWQAKSDVIVRGNIGYSRGTILHHWHGHSEERGYEKRWSILTFHQFNSATDLVTEESGLQRWAGNKPRLEQDILMSLSSRNEDAI